MLLQWWVYFRTLMAWFPLQTRRPGKYYLAHRSFFTTPIWRLPATYQQDRLVVMRMLSYTLKRLWKEKLPAPAAAADGLAVFAGRNESEQVRMKYMTLVSGAQPSTYIARENLAKGRGLFSQLLITACVLQFAFWLFPICLLSRRRANYALVLLSFSEACQLVWVLRKAKVREVICFDIYENDSNALAILLMLRGITVNKNTSDVPVCMINPCIIADVVSCCQKFQEAEIRALSRTMRVGKVQTWLPENFEGIAPRYKIPQDYAAVPALTVGFYSSGSWIREREGYPDLGDGFYAVEKQLKLWLRDYFESRRGSGIRMIVFPHPNEKKTEQDYADAIAHYKQVFAGTDFEMRPRSSSTLSEFHFADVAISVYSTVSYERLFMGFKSLIFPYQMNYLPPGTPLDKIAPEDQGELFDLLDRSLAVSREEFFRDAGLAGGTVESFMGYYTAVTTRG